ncbi:MAG TPA: CinA family protein [Microlunatus sp.]|nr:CinA family protein [Microlunatus sp.]
MIGPDSAADTSAAAPAGAVVAALRERSQTLATAESLTGGLVGATLTAVPGASAVYRGGLIVYATELKAELARVSPQTLAADGPVAASTAAQLARGAADVCGADWGLATTGVAGPDPQDGHPVGQVYVAVAGPPSDEVPEGSTEGDQVGVQVQELSLVGDRWAIRDQTTRAVLQLLLDRLQAGHPAGRSAPSGVAT